MYFKNAILAAIILFSTPVKAESKFILISYCKTPIIYIGGDDKRTVIATSSHVFENPDSSGAKYLLKTLKSVTKKNFHNIQLELLAGLECPIDV